MDKIILYVPASIENVHFVSDVTESFAKSRIEFGSKEQETDFMNDIKLIMYELFSNCVLHGYADNIKVTYGLEDEHISIEMELKGKGFMIKPVKGAGSEEIDNYYPPYSVKIQGKEFILYNDPENQVLCKVLGPKELFFSHKKVNSEEDSIENIPEHYGILLITSLSKHFSYKRTNEGVDIFLLKKSVKDFI
jgi:anti-sigma regulatory factor (Ser/Thr protein kinase)